MQHIELSPVASFTKEFNLRLAKRPLVFNGRLANRGLNSLVKEATGHSISQLSWCGSVTCNCTSLSGVPDYFYRNKISSGGDLSHYSSASLY